MQNIVHRLLSEIQTIRYCCRCLFTLVEKLCHYNFVIKSGPHTEKIILMMWVKNQSLRHRIIEIVEQTYELVETLVINHVDDTQHHKKTVLPTRMAKVCQTVKELHNIMLQK